MSGFTSARPRLASLALEMRARGLEPEGKQRRAMVVASAGFGWKLDYDGDDAGLNLIRVPRGMITDGASVPRFAWWFLPPLAGSHMPAALVHDAGYAAGIHRRRTCDKAFKEAMGVLSTPWLQRNAAYLAVRLFGWWAWRGNARRRNRRETNRWDLEDDE